MRQFKIILFASLMTISQLCGADVADINKSAKKDIVGQNVVQAGFGSGPDDLGVVFPPNDAGDSEGPSSFVVDEAGVIYILDQVNSQIQVYRNGARIKTVPIGSHTVEYLGLLPGGGFVLLDRSVKKKLIFIDAAGSVKSQVDIEGKHIAHSGSVTGIEVRNDGVWAEVIPDSVLVAGIDGKAVDRRTMVKGAWSRDGSSLIKTKLLGEKSIRIDIKSSKENKWKQHTVVFEKEVYGITAVYTDDSKRIYLGVYLGEAGRDVWDSQEVVVLDSDGKELKRVALALSDDTYGMMPRFRVGGDGSIYRLVLEEERVVIKRYAP